MPTARPIIVSMFTTKKESSKTCPTSRRHGQRDAMETMRGRAARRRDHGAEHDQQDHERDRQAEQLAGLQVLFGLAPEVVADAGTTRDVGVDAVLAVLRLDELHDVADVLVGGAGVARHAQRERHGVAVGRRGGGLRRAGDDVRAEGGDLAAQVGHGRLERGVGADPGVGADDEGLDAGLLGRQALGQQVVRPFDSMSRVKRASDVSAEGNREAMITKERTSAAPQRARTRLGRAALARARRSVKDGRGVV